MIKTEIPLERWAAVRNEALKSAANEVKYRMLDEALNLSPEDHHKSFEREQKLQNLANFAQSKIDEQLDIMLEKFQ